MSHPTAIPLRFEAAPAPVRTEIPAPLPRGGASATFALGLLLLSLLQLILPQRALAEGGPEPAATDLRVCNGFNPVTGGWSWLPGIHQVETVCPDGWYILTAHTVGHLAGPEPESIGMRFTCCPGPADLLTKEHRYVALTCPADHLMTGERLEAASIIRGEEGFRTAKKSLRCTALNPRYKTAPARARVLDNLTSLNEEWLSNTLERPEKEIRFSRFHLPLAIRFAVGRVDATSYELDWCLGEPFGSALVGRFGRACIDYEFRRVVYRGAGADPKEGTPVRMFPDCIAIEDRDSPNPRCVPAPLPETVPTAAPTPP